MRSEVLAFAFGALVILVTFGDNHLIIGGGTVTVGNLDTVFGLAVWPVLDAVYFTGSIAVFLLYGWTKGSGRLRFNLANVLVIASFLVVLTLISIDDFATLLHLPLNPPTVYWDAVSWVYPICSSLSFILFNRHTQP